MTNRNYNVLIVDTKGNTIIQFTGTVIKKEQPRGRLGIGPVDEVLHVSRARFYDKDGKPIKIGK